MSDDLQAKIESAWSDRTLLKDSHIQAAVKDVIELLDKGKLRVSEYSSQKDTWVVQEWVKKAVLLYFPINQMQTLEAGPLEFHDKIPLKKNYAEQGVRAVPHAIARYGSFLGRDVVMMPSYVNIGAYVGEGTMVDTWATVGSCAQIGKQVHLSGGVGIGGVLEPLQAAPVIIEDDAFIGSRSIVVEGARVGKRAILGANTVITKTSRVIDVTGTAPKLYRGVVPADSIVIPGSDSKSFPAGHYQVSAALIIGKRNAQTDLKTSLNQVLRENEIVI